MLILSVLLIRYARVCEIYDYIAVVRGRLCTKQPTYLPMPDITRGVACVTARHFFL